MLAVIACAAWTAGSTAQATPDDADIEFGTRTSELEFPTGTGEDVDTVRKITPRHLSIAVGDTVTFHVNGSPHQVLIYQKDIKPSDVGIDGVNADTPYPPDSYSAAVATATGLRSGNRPDANGAGCQSDDR